MTAPPPLLWSRTADQRDVFEISRTALATLRAHTAGPEPMRAIRHPRLGRGSLHGLDSVEAWIRRIRPWTPEAAFQELRRRAVPLTPQDGWTEVIQ